MKNFAKFERKDPFPQVPFAYDSDSYPSIAEAMGWIILGGAFLCLAVGFLAI